MKRKTSLQNFKKIGFIVILIFFSLISAIFILLQSFWIPTSYSILGIKKTSQEVQFAQVTRRYVNGVSDSSTIEDLDTLHHYNSREIVHLRDVREVINQVKVVYLGILIILGVLLTKYPVSKNIEELRTILKKSFISLLVTGIITVVTWENTFTIFHQIFFKGDSWLFYETDLLIQLFPPEFWALSGGVMFLGALMILMALYLGSFVNFEKNKK